MRLQDAFCCFDASEDGYLEPSEVAEVLCTSNTPGRATRALSDKLFAQLDFDGSGGISFKEFLIGLEKMVRSSRWLGAGSSGGRAPGGQGVLLGWVPGLGWPGGVPQRQEVSCHRVWA